MNIWENKFLGRRRRRLRVRRVARMEIDGYDRWVGEGRARIPGIIFHMTTIKPAFPWPRDLP